MKKTFSNIKVGDSIYYIEIYDYIIYNFNVRRIIEIQDYCNELGYYWVRFFKKVEDEIKLIENGKTFYEEEQLMGFQIYKEDLLEDYVVGDDFIFYSNI